MSNENTKIRLASSGLAHTPGLVAAMRNDYNIGGDRKEFAVNVIAETYFKGDHEPAEYVLANPDKCEIDEEESLVVYGLNIDVTAQGGV